MASSHETSCVRNAVPALSAHASTEPSSCAHLDDSQDTRSMNAPHDRRGALVETTWTIVKTRHERFAQLLAVLFSEDEGVEPTRAVRS